MFARLLDDQRFESHAAGQTSKTLAVDFHAVLAKVEVAL